MKEPKTEVKFIRQTCDIIIHVDGGMVQGVELPNGFAGRVVVMDYDGEGAEDWEDVNEDGEPCNIAVHAN